MILADISGARIARTLGLDRSSINKVVNGQSKSRRVREAIAAALGLRVPDLWPDAKDGP